MKVQPIRKKLLVKLVKRDERTASGIWIPEDVKTREGDKAFGIVVAVGPKADKELKPGQKVVFLSYHGDDIVIEGEAHKLMDDCTIFAVIHAN